MSQNFGQNPFYQGQYALPPSDGGQNAASYYGQQPVSWTQGWFAFNDPGYIKGLVVGAAVTYVLTNPKVQRALVKGAVSLWASVQGGFEELKEQVQDIKSEMSMKSDEPKS